MKSYIFLSSLQLLQNFIRKSKKWKQSVTQGIWSSLKKLLTKLSGTICMDVFSWYIHLLLLTLFYLKDTCLWCNCVTQLKLLYGLVSEFISTWYTHNVLYLFQCSKFSNSKFSLFQKDYFRSFPSYKLYCKW